MNLAVEGLAAAQRLGGVSVLANGDCCEKAVRFLCSHPELSAGIHLNVVEGKPLSGGVGILLRKDHSFVGLSLLIRRWLLHPREVSRAVETEWRAQIEAVLAAGVRLTHADSHQHLHAFPPAYACAVKICREFSIPALRWPSESTAWLTRPAGFAALHCALAVSDLMMPRTRLLRNDHILGFGTTAGYELGGLLKALRRLPDGITELVTHPSVRDGQPYARLSGNRQREALLDKSLLEQIADLHIEVTSWEALARSQHAN